MLSIVLMLLSVFLYTQELPKIVPLSTDLSSLGNFFETPVSLNTGIPKYKDTLLLLLELRTLVSL